MAECGPVDLNKLVEGREEEALRRARCLASDLGRDQKRGGSDRAVQFPLAVCTLEGTDRHEFVRQRVCLVVSRVVDTLLFPEFVDEVGLDPGLGDVGLH